ncbi:MAG: cytochrome c [Candidatus Zixiibacteriota bacterium]
MSRALFTLAIACISLALFACGGGAPSDETRTPGEIAFRRNCQTCHSLPKPSLKTDDEWPSTVARYAPRAKLTPEDIAAITAYLVSANGG